MTIDEVPYIFNLNSRKANRTTVISSLLKTLTLFRPVGGGGGGGLLRPYKTLKLNNFKTVKAMTTKFSDFS